MSAHRADGRRSAPGTAECRGRASSGRRLHRRNANGLRGRAPWAAESSAKLSLFNSRDEKCPEKEKLCRQLRECLAEIVEKDRLVQPSIRAAMTRARVIRLDVATHENDA